MAVIGTFGSYTAARLGIYASQASLSATGNNIANINTVGYTRQRMDLVSLYSYGTVRYANGYQQNIGYGVLTDSVSQLRDPFLDIRFREENASAGAYEQKLDCLQQLAYILDEVGKGNNEFGIIAGQLEDFLSQLQNLNGKVGSVEYDTTVRGSAQTLARLFNNYAKAMDTLATNKLNELKENVKTVNALLTQIRDLNVQIRDAGIMGDSALELRDARNLCIDQLSAYMKIDVSYDMEKIDQFTSVERINISIADSGTPPIKLIQGIYGAQISMPDMIAEKNLEHDPGTADYNEFISKMYIDKDTGKLVIEYTNNAKSAWTDNDTGDLIRNNSEAVELLIKKLNDMKEEELAAAKGTFQTANDLKAEQERLEGLKTTLNNTIAGLQTQLDAMTGEEDDYEARQAELEARQAELLGIQSQLDKVGEDIQANEKDIERIESEYGITTSGKTADAINAELDTKIGDKYTELENQLTGDTANGLLGGVYFNSETANAPYIRKDGAGTTWNEDEANAIPNAMEDAASENRLTMIVEPLVDVKGRYMRDEYHRQVKTSVELTDNQLYGSLQSLREFLTEKGEFSSDKDLALDADAAQKRGLPYYQKALDALVKKFAEAFNQANQLNFEDVRNAYEFGDADGPGLALSYGFYDSDMNIITGFDENGNQMDLTPGYFDELAQMQTDLADLKKRAAAGQLKDGEAETIQELEKKIETGYKNLDILREKGVLTEEWSFYNGGVLFSNSGDSNDSSGITARNITVSKDWMIGDVRILNTKKADGLEHSTANDNILHMIELMSEDMNYFPNEVTDGAMNGGARKYFTGSFAERLADMNSIMGVDTQTTSMLYNEYTATTLSLENSRQSISGVDLNDEATNMMVYQKAYAAACQLMTTLDSMLDKLINGTLR